VYKRTRPVHGGHVHGRVRAVHTAVYTTRIRPRTRVYVYMAVLHGRVRAIYRAENGRLHGRVTCRVYGSVRAVSAHVHGSVRAVYTGRVHCRFRPSTQRVHGLYTAVYKGRLGRVYGR